MRIAVEQLIVLQNSGILIHPVNDDFREQILGFFDSIRLFTES